MISRATVIRKLGHRAVNWSAISSKLTSDSAKAELNRYKSLCGEINSLHKAFAAEPAPIDFAAYKAKLDSMPGAVDSLEKAYKAANLPSYSIGWIKDLEQSGAFDSSPELKAKHAQLAAFVEDAADFQSSYDAKLKEAEAAISESTSRIAELEDIINTLESKKIGLDTTVDEILARHPEIEKEVDEEINNHQWAKDI